MKISDFDYNLPVERIALYPPVVRGQSRLLVLDRKTGNLEDKKYSDIADYLESGEVLVLNNTRVIPARITAFKPTGGKIELVILERHDKNKSSNLVMYKGKITEGDKLTLRNNYTIKVIKLLGNGIAEVESNTDLYDLAEVLGEVPIPPYMHRDSEQIDKERYQTVFAKEKGSVAAPTASLNFTEELKQKLENKGVIIAYLTLHVGLGTFLPVREDDVEKHDMHSEFFVIPTDTINKIKLAKQNNKKVTAIGTTVTRTLEYAAKQILSENSEGNEITGEANIFIYPGYEFKIVDQLITNFHAPRSTVLLLANAFAGVDNLKNAYNHALEQEYKFLSYGDSMMII